MHLPVTIKDPEVHRHDLAAATSVQGPIEDDLRPIVGLMDADDFFWIREGEQSPRVIEVAQLILSPELRPALRTWYQQAGDKINPHALEMREKFSELAGEQFGAF